MLDNCELAVLCKLNELAERRGLKPYEFVATFQSLGDGNRYGLNFEVPVSEHKTKEERFERMLSEIGAHDGQLLGPIEEIVDALDRALDKSPRPGHRR